MTNETIFFDPSWAFGPYRDGAARAVRLLRFRSSSDPDLVWSTTWESAKTELSRMDGLTPDGTQIVVSGQTSGFGSGGNDALMLGYDLDGKLAWSTI